MTAEGFDIRVLPINGIEDHHAHLLRLDYLDRCLFFSVGNDDRAVDAHCLRLIASQAIVIGAYDEGRLRASVEIIPDRAARSGRAISIGRACKRSGQMASAGVDSWCGLIRPTCGILGGPDAPLPPPPLPCEPAPDPAP